MYLSIRRGKAAKYDGESKMVQAATKNCFGYNWWEWKPSIKLRLKSYGMYFDSYWLCYFWGFTLNYRTRGLREFLLKGSTPVNVEAGTLTLDKVDSLFRSIKDGNKPILKNKCLFCGKEAKVHNGSWIALCAEHFKEQCPDGKMPTEKKEFPNSII